MQARKSRFGWAVFGFCLGAAAVGVAWVRDAHWQAMVPVAETQNDEYDELGIARYPYLTEVVTDVDFAEAASRQRVTLADGSKHWAARWLNGKVKVGHRYELHRHSSGETYFRDMGRFISLAEQAQEGSHERRD